MRYVYAPGCALTDYKPRLAEKVRAFLNESSGEIPLYGTCCRVPHTLAEGTTVINTCPGCNRRFKEEHAGIVTVSLWEVLADCETFPFPDYGGLRMAIHDACPTRSEPKVHAAVRTLLQKMNIKVIEPEFTKENQRCCGDSAYPGKSIPEIFATMKARADEMPLEQVCVYCVACVKAIATGGKTPALSGGLALRRADRPKRKRRYRLLCRIAGLPRYGGKLRMRNEQHKTARPNGQAVFHAVYANRMPLFACSAW